MCAGQSRRYPKPYPKPLEPILGEPNYKRTIRLLNENKINNVIISVSDENYNYFDYENKIIGSNKREIDRFRNLREYIDNEALILYGDVVYYEADLKNILNNINKNINFFGRFSKFNCNEIFGIYVSDKDKFFNAVDSTALKFENNLLKREIGLDVFKELGTDKNDLITLSEKTNDYDIVAQYEKIKKLYSEIL